MESGRGIGSGDVLDVRPEGYRSRSVWRSSVFNNENGVRGSA